MTSKPLALFITKDDVPPTSKVALRLVVEVDGEVYAQSLVGNAESVKPMIHDIYSHWHEVAKQRRQQQPPGQRATLRVSLTRPAYDAPKTASNPSLNKNEEPAPTQETDGTLQASGSGILRPNLPRSPRQSERSPSRPPARSPRVGEETKSKSPGNEPRNKSPGSDQRSKSPHSGDSNVVSEGEGGIIDLTQNEAVREISPLRKYIPENMRSSCTEEQLIEHLSAAGSDEQLRGSSAKEGRTGSGIGSILSGGVGMFGVFDAKNVDSFGVKDFKHDDDIVHIQPPGRKPNAQPNKRYIEVVTDHSEYEPGDEITGSVAINIKKPMVNVGSVIVNFKGIESCFGGLDMTNLDQAVQSFESEFHTSLFFNQSIKLWEAPSSSKAQLKGQFCFPFTFKIPTLLPHSLRVHAHTSKLNHLASVYYFLEAMTVPFDKTKKISPSEAQKTLLLSQPVEILLYGLHPEKLLKNPPSPLIHQQFKLQRASGILTGTVAIPKPDLYLGKPIHVQLSLQNPTQDQLQTVTASIEQIVFNIKDQKEIRKDRFVFYTKKDVEHSVEHVFRFSIDAPVQNYEKYYTRSKDCPLVPSIAGLNISISHSLLILLHFSDHKKDSTLKIPIKVWETPLPSSNP